MWSREKALQNLIDRSVIQENLLDRIVLGSTVGIAVVAALAT